MMATIYQAKAQLPRILQRVEQGEELVLRKGKHPIVRIVPSDTAKPKLPKVGEPTSPRFEIPPDALAPWSGEFA